MGMNAVERMYLRDAIKAITALVENDAANAIMFEWKVGSVPKLTFVPNVPLEHVEVSFTVEADPDERV